MDLKWRDLFHAKAWTLINVNPRKRNSHKYSKSVKREKTFALLLKKGGGGTQVIKVIRNSVCSNGGVIQSGCLSPLQIRWIHSSYFICYRSTTVIRSPEPGQTERGGRRLGESFFLTTTLNLHSSPSEQTLEMKFFHLGVLIAYLETGDAESDSLRAVSRVQLRKNVDWFQCLVISN